MTDQHNPHNPLIPSYTVDPNDGPHDASASQQSVLQPAQSAANTGASRAPESKNAAADIVRQKLAAIYGEEPGAQEEIAEVKAITSHRSKHQQFMLDLNNSGKPLAQIQAAWHQYYAELPDDQKREVWQEFYNNSAKSKAAQGHAQLQAAAQPQPVQTPQQQSHISQQAQQAPIHTRSPLTQPVPTVVTTPQDQLPGYNAADDRSPSNIREQIRGKVGSRSKLKVKHHIQSLLFGLGFGGLVLVIVLFSFFNEVIIAPFIQPSRKVSATPIIVGTDATTSPDKSEVIIPKINLEIPLDFSAKSIDENEIENGLENGVVHYPTTALPGQQGNAAFFGHSSNNIFNPGKYKFAFVLLHELVTGDTFNLTYKGVNYTYQVFDKKVVDPSDVSVLNPVAGKASTAVLITCDPPGTSLHRLVVWGEQVSPNPSTNVVPAPTPTTSGAEQTLPGNGPTLWRRLVNAITGN